MLCIDRVFFVFFAGLEFCGLDTLLEAGRQVLLEAIESQSHIRLPRELDPNKKYSWRQKKDEPVMTFFYFLSPPL